MLTFSTDELPAKDRFAHWREERGKAVFGVTIELHRSQHAEFKGRFSAQPIGAAMLVEMRGLALQGFRTEADVADARRADALCIYQQIDGGGWFGAGGSEFVVVGRQDRDKSFRSSLRDHAVDQDRL